MDYGPFPEKVVDWVRAHADYCVQGNHDQIIISCYYQGLTAETVPESQRMWAHHNVSRLDAADIAFLENLPLAQNFTLDGTRYGLSHLYEDYAEIVSRHAFAQFRAATFAPPGQEQITRLIFGHTHRQGVRYLSDTWLWLNPGSVSYRRLDDPDPTAHYITITDGRIALRGAQYDRSPLVKTMRKIPLKKSERQHVERFI